ncbi:MAG: HAD hydrolase family protein [Elusimicrobiota bacterium]|jgi:YrbI family 3-deoxy-D-manno-octulosonate 8-phosphate phosphatase|nr:HAD hydrolase family protein [Elusimicrobiota bacterium]
MATKRVKYTPAVLARARKIKLVLTDVDGVLTDSSMNFFTTPDGKTVEIKKFSAYDGIAFHMLRDSGIQTGIITGGNAPATAHRAHSLGMDFLYYNFLSKKPPLEHILLKTGLKAQQVAYIGDDLIDIPILLRAGLACAVKNAREEVKQICHYTTAAESGQGVFREVAELVLRAQGFWDEVLAKARAGKIGLSRKKTPVLIDFKTWGLE